MHQLPTRFRLSAELQHFLVTMVQISGLSRISEHGFATILIRKSSKMQKITLDRDPGQGADIFRESQISGRELVRVQI